MLQAARQRYQDQDQHQDQARPYLPKVLAGPDSKTTDKTNKRNKRTDVSCVIDCASDGQLGL